MNEAVLYLKSKGLIHTQKDLAEAIGSTAPNISKMLKGDPKVLTDSICIRIQKVFKMISADWLITGDGEMIVATDSNIKQMTLPDYSSLVNATIAAKDEAIASLKRELDAKDLLIRSLRQQVADLGLTIAALKERSTSGYPFTMGVAEEGIAPTKIATETSAKFPSNRK